MSPKTANGEQRVPSETTPERVLIAGALLSAGRSIGEVAELLHAQPGTIHRWMNRYPGQFAAAARRNQRPQIIVPPPLPPPERLKINPLTEERIRKATALLAAGEDREEVARQCGVTVEGMKEWQKLHPKFWKEEYGRAMTAAIAVVRRIAGTEAVSADPERFVRQATRADRWARDHGESLFPKREGWTVSTFYERYYKPLRLTDATAVAIAKYEGTVKRWGLLTGDPPLTEISGQTLAAFRVCLEKMCGKGRVLPMSSATVRGHVNTINTLLTKAGPPGPRNRDAADILAKPPWLRPPRVDPPTPRIPTPEQISAAYQGAASMDVPWGDGVKPPAWWKALLAVAFNTGLRRRSLFDLRWEWVDLKRSRITIPPRSTKSRRIQIIHLNPAALSHLAAIRTDREKVFPWPGSMKMFYTHFHKLLQFAGIPRKDHFGLHGLRKALATVLWEESPQAAQFALGHAGMAVTRSHYIAGDAMLARALDDVPQPTAFLELQGAAV
jgi:integrase